MYRLPGEEEEEESLSDVLDEVREVDEEELQEE
jgi:hypothetical protein